MPRVALVLVLVLACSKNDGARPRDPEPPAPADALAGVAGPVDAAAGPVDAVAAVPPDAPAKPHAKGAIVVGVTRTTHLVCGGVPPRPGQQQSRTELVRGEKFLVRKGDRNTAAAPIAEVVTDADGSFDLVVPPGTYCIVPEDKRTAKAARAGGVHTDQSCLDRIAAQCNLVIEAPTDSAKIDLLVPCFGPCYRGPLPP